MASAIQSALNLRFDAPVEPTRQAAAKNAYRTAARVEASESGKLQKVALSDKTLSRFAFFRFRALGLAESRAISGSSMLASAMEGATVLAKVLDRLGALSNQAEKDGISEPERSALRTQFQTLEGDLRQNLRQPRAGNVSLLDGSGENITIPVDDGEGDELDITPFEQSLDPDSEHGLDLSGLSLDSPEDAKATSQKLDSARAVVARTLDRFGHAMRGLENLSKRIQADHQQDVESKSVDIDSTQAQATLAQQQIVAQASGALLAQSNASPARAYDVLVN